MKEYKLLKLWTLLTFCVMVALVIAAKMGAFEGW